MRKIRIEDFEVGHNEKTFIIAEAGINHDGNLKQAKKLVDEAANAGANAVKFQIFKAEEFCAENSEFFVLFKSLELEEDNWIEIAEFSNDKKIIFTASVFGEESANILEKTGSPVYKVSSGDLTDRPLLDYIARKEKPIILSTGMSTISEIDEAIRTIYNKGNNNVALMHCISNYPTAYHETNLNSIQTLQNTFQIPVGFSDHTIGTLLPALATVKGANLIEKHFTLNKHLPGPDHKMSLEPDEFKEMVTNVRIAESALGNGIKKLTKDEKILKKSARRSIKAKVDISRGNLIKKENTKIVRPEEGLEPKFVDIVYGKTAKVDIKKDEPITWDKI